MGLRPCQDEWGIGWLQVWTLWDDEGRSAKPDGMYRNFALQPGVCLTFDFIPKCIVVGSTDGGCHAGRPTIQWRVNEKLALGTGEACR